MSRFFILLLALLAGLPLCGSEVDADADDGYRPWNDTVVDAFAHLPVQEGGRIKPLDTAAAFLLLRLNGRRSTTVSVADERVRLDHMAWALDVLFRPEIAENYQIFLVQNSEVLDHIGLPPSERKRDRYSLAQLQQAERRLFELNISYARIEHEQRSRLEQQTLDLSNNYFDYRRFADSFAFARKTVRVDHTTAMAMLYDGRNTVPVSVALAKMPTLIAAGRLAMTQAEADEATRARELQGLLQVVADLERIAAHDGSLRWIPPNPDSDTPLWFDVGALIETSINEGRASELGQQIDCLAAMERFVEAAPDARSAAADALRDTVAELAAGNDAGDKIALEVLYHRLDLFYRALYGFLLAFLLATLLWLRPRSKLLATGVWLLSAASLALVITGIVMRCVLRERPPVSTLYETVLFITAVGVLVALIIEAINRRRIMLSLAPFLGAFGMFLAASYEASEAQDTMPTLVAVLDTNFWLATHVTTVTMGYAAGLLAGLIAHVAIVAQLLCRDGGGLRYQCERMIYGVLCFGLLFSIVGTILGGIWAAESWGRFWGWDPKENGALMIVLWELIILHSRIGGLIRSFGLAVMAVINTIIVAFSWWHVNMLGEGLHSYGQTDGQKLVLFTCYGFELLFLLIAVTCFLLQKRRIRSESPEVPAPPPAPSSSAGS